MTFTGTAGHAEHPLIKTKIIATVGPACESEDLLRQMIVGGVDLFRVNFAHGTHEGLAVQTAAVRRVAAGLGRSVAILGDLGGPKIRLRHVPGGALQVRPGDQCTFVRQASPDDPTALTTTYDGLVDDLRVGNAVLLADGAVALRVVDTRPGRVVCEVEQPGALRRGQGVNLPGSRLRLPSITEKDRLDLAWALAHELDFIGLSFVRAASDIRELRGLMRERQAGSLPGVVAKIEKPEAVDALDDLLTETDAVMVARGDLGVEVDMVRVPVIQKTIIRECNRRRVPVITATQMLDSMHHSRTPTRAEVSDVANAVLDGTDAVMLSGETAIGAHPLEAVRVMSRIIADVEPLVARRAELPFGAASPRIATRMTSATALGALHAADHLAASLLVVVTRTGKTALAVSQVRSAIPILAVTDSSSTARRLCLAWGVTPVVTDVCRGTPQRVMTFAVDWGERQGVLAAGDRVVLVGTTDWSTSVKDLMLVHTVQ